MSNRRLAIHSTKLATVGTLCVLTLASVTPADEFILQPRLQGGGQENSSTNSRPVAPPVSTQAPQSGQLIWRSVSQGDETQAHTASFQQPQASGAAGGRFSGNFVGSPNGRSDADTNRLHTRHDTSGPSHPQTQIQFNAPETVGPADLGITSGQESTIAAELDTSGADNMRVHQPKRTPITTVSHSRSLAPTSPSDNLPPQRIGRITPPPGWQAVAEKLGQHIQRCEHLLQRSAFYSAREEAELGMAYMVHILDGLANRYESEPAWLAAKQALLEAESFDVQPQSVGRSNLRDIVQTHGTPILKDADFSALAPMTAAQHYRLYAKFQLLRAAQEHPWCSELFYAIGRCYQAQAESQPQGANLLRHRAIVFFRAASEVNPSNILATNQLGFLLLKMDQPQQAKSVLIQSVNTQTTAPALQNLIEAAYRLQDQPTLEWAVATLQSIDAPTAEANQLPTVVEVSPSEFMALSPYSSGPTPR